MVDEFQPRDRPRPAHDPPHSPLQCPGNDVSARDESLDGRDPHHPRPRGWGVDAYACVFSFSFCEMTMTVPLVLDPNTRVSRASVADDRPRYHSLCGSFSWRIPCAMLTMVTKMK